MNDSDNTRREKIVARMQAQSGVDEALIERVVRRFYEHVQQDALLGPIFASRIVEWEPHLARMQSFWSSVALMSGQYHGQPMPLHARLAIESRHFDRWLELFEATVLELCEPLAARHFMERAHRIAQSLEIGVAAANGIILKRDERYVKMPEVSGPLA